MATRLIYRTEKTRGEWVREDMADDECLRRLGELRMQGHKEAYVVKGMTTDKGGV